MPGGRRVGPSGLAARQEHRRPEPVPGFHVVTVVTLSGGSSRSAQVATWVERGIPRFTWGSNRTRRRDGESPERCERPGLSVPADLVVGEDARGFVPTGNRRATVSDPPVGLTTLRN